MKNVITRYEDTGRKSVIPPPLKGSLGVQKFRCFWAKVTLFKNFTKTVSYGKGIKKDALPENQVSV